MPLGGRNLPSRPPNIINGRVGWMLFILMIANRRQKFGRDRYERKHQLLTA
ncbi:hypothetical protein [Nostoc sp.]|uniref:hypothetical protein n=1 Tax=Nostoc sp. TaxID=1180 RepID=UPI002D76C0E7|nr:hypothetical protein [Nostoc sp.]